MMETTSIVRENDYNFPVSLQPVFTKDQVQVPRTCAVVRTDTNQPLSVVSDRYELYTHSEVMDAVKPFVKALGAAETSYALERNGAKLIATHTFRGVNIQVPRAHAQTSGENQVGDVIALRLHIINSYNRSTSLEFQLGGMVLRCLNGMTLFQELFQFRHAHLADSWDRSLPDPHLVTAAFHKAGVRIKEWSEQEIDKKTREMLVNAGISTQLLPKRYYEKEEHRFSSAATAWDLYNAFTFVITHSSKRIQQSGQLARYDRLNSLFTHVLKNEIPVHADVV